MKKLFTLVLVMFAFVTIHADVYYWVGNGGNWSDYNNHWATSSGGGTFHASAPTMMDTVIFDASSFGTTGQTVNIDSTAYCYTLDMSGITNNPTLYMPSWSYYLDVYGSLIFSGNATYNMKIVYVNDGGAANVIASNGAYLGSSSDLVMYYPGYCVLSDSLHVNYLDFYGGYLDLGGQSMNVNSSISLSGSASDVFDMTNARIYTRNFYGNSSISMYTTGSTIYLSNINSNYFSGAGQYYNDLVVQGSTQFDGSNSFNQLQILPAADVQFQPGSTQTVNGNLIANGVVNKEITLRSNQDGTQAEIFSMNPVSLDYVIIKDIYANGIIPFYATNSIEISNNTNWSITPPPSSNYYWVGNGGNWSDISHWSSLTGGTPDVSEAPSKYDNVYFDNNSFTSTGQTVTIDDTAYCRNLDLSAVTNNPVLYMNSSNNDLFINGSFLMGSNATFNLRQVWFISSAHGNTITSNGNSTGNNAELYFNGEGSWSMLDSLNARDINLFNGYLDLNGQAVNLGENGTFSIQASSTDTLDMTGAAIYTDYFTVYSGINLLTDSSVIHMINLSSSYFYGHGYTFNDLVIHGYAYIENGSNTFNTLEIYPGAEVVLPAGYSQTVNELIATGSKFSLIDIHSNSSGSPAGIYSDYPVNVEWVVLKDIAASGDGAPFIADYSTDNTGNSGWIFTPPTGSDYFWVGGTGNWKTPEEWSSTSGGPADKTERPSRFDNVYFDGNSFTAPGQVVTIDTLQACSSLDMTGVTNNPTLYMDPSYGRLDVDGSFILSENASYNLYQVYFVSSGWGNIIDTWGQDLGVNARFRFEGGGSWSLADSLNIPYLYFQSGSLDLGGQPVNLGENGQFYIYGNLGDSLDMSWASIYTSQFLDRTGGTLVTEGSSVYMISPDNGYFDGNSIVYNDLIVDGYLYLEYDNNTFNSLEILPGSEVYFPNGRIQTVGELIANGTKTNEIIMHSNSSGSPATIHQSSGSVNVEWVNLQDMTATGVVPFIADNSTDGGGNTGWTINPPVPATYYWIGGSGAWSDLSHWSTSSGGIDDQVYLPGKLDSVFFDAGSFSAAGTLAIDMKLQLGNLDFSALDKAVEMVNPNNYQLDLYGSLNLPAEMEWHINSINLFSESAGNTIRNGYHLSNSNVYFYGSGEYILTDSTSIYWFDIYNGSVNFNDQPVTATYITIEGSQHKDLYLGSSDILIYSRWMMNAADVSMDAGTSTITIDEGYFYADQQNIGTLSYNNVVFRGYLYFYSSNPSTISFNTMTIESGAHLYFQAGATFLINDLLATGTSSYPTYFYSSSSSTQYTFVKNTGTVNISYVRLQDAAATGGAVFNAIESTNGGNNTGWNFISDTTPPEFISGYPFFSDTTESGFKVYVKMNEGGTLYYVLMPDSSDAPSVAEVTGGTGAGGATPIQSGSFSIDQANAEILRSFSSLSTDTQYDLFMVAKDGAATPNLQDTVTLLNVKTSGNVAPVFQAGYPALVNIYESMAEFEVRINEPSIVYYAVLPRGATAPTPSQMKAGSSPGFQPVYWNFYTHSQPEYTYNQSVYSMTGDTEYDLYFVAEDLATVRNLQDTVTLLQFATAPFMPPVFTSGYPYIDNIQDNRFYFYISLDEPSDVYYVVLPDGASAPSVSQVLNGQDAGGSDALLSGKLDYNNYGSVNSYIVYGVEKETAYDVYLVAQDVQTVPNVQSSVTQLNLNTSSDTYYPEFYSGPTVANALDHSVDMVLSLNEAGSVYYIIDTTGSSYPSANQVFAGTTSTGGIPVTSGSILVSEAFSSIVSNLGGLDAEKGYWIYLAAQDDEAVPNRMNYVEGRNFTTTRESRDYYWIGNGGNWSDTTHWVGASGGTDYHSTPPTKADNVYFDDNSFSLAGQQVTVDQTIYFNDMSWTNSVYQPTFYSGNNINAYGSITIPSNIKLNVYQVFLKASDADNVLAIDFTGSQGDYLSYLYIQSYGDYTITDSARYHYISYSYGNLTFDAPASVNEFYFYNNNNIKTLTLNNIDLQVYYFGNSAGTSVDIVSNNSRMLVNSYFESQEGQEYPTIVFNGDVQAYGSPIIDSLILMPGITVTLDENGTFTVGELIAQGTKTEMIEIKSSTAGRQSRIKKTSGTVDGEFLKISDNLASGGAVFNASNSFDKGNNSGWSFTVPEFKDYYWIGGTGLWSDLSHWSQTSGGPADHSELPGEFENVYFDQNSFSASGFVTLDMDVSVKTLDASALDQPVTFNEAVGPSATIYVYGSLLLPEQLTWQVYPLYLKSDSAGNTIENGYHLSGTAVYFSGKGEYILSDSTSINELYFYSGTLDLNDQPLWVRYFYIEQSTSKTLKMGSSKLYIDYYWYMGSSNVSMDAGTSTIILDGGYFFADQYGIGLSYNDVLFKSNNDYLYNSASFNTLTITSGTYLYVQNGKTVTFDDLIAAGTQSNKIYFQSTSAGSQYTFVKNSGTVNVFNVGISDAVATGGAVFNAYESTDNGNNLGWNFLADTTPPEFLAGYPLFRDSLETSFVLAVRINEGGKLYYVLMPDSSEVPTVTDVVNGAGAGGAAALANGYLTLTSVGNEYTKTFTGLTTDTPYDLFVVAQDDAAALNLQDTVTLLDVKTSGNIAPLFLQDYPVVSHTYENFVEFKIMVNEPAWVYSAVVARGTTAPTPEQLEAGSSAGFQPINHEVYDHSNINIVFTRSLNGLTPGSDYDLYLVAKDKAAVPNLQDSVTLLQFTTAPNMPPVFAPGYPYINYIQDSRFNLYIAIDEPSEWFYVIVPDGATAPSVSQVMLGQQADGSDAFLSGDFNYYSYGGVDGYEIRGTEPVTSYDVYVVARDKQTVPNVQAFVTKLDLTTTVDIYPPEYQINPTQAAILDQSVQISFQINEAGMAYYVVDTAGSAQPSVNQVFAGTTSNDAVPVASGTFDVTAGYITVVGQVTGLDPEKSYRIFVVVEDDEATPNRITYVRYVNFTTTRTPRDYYWIGNSGVWTDLGHWSQTSGGPADQTEIPTQIDNVYFDDQSFTLADQTVTVNQNIYFNDMVWINDTLQPKLQSNYTLYAYGSVIVPDSIRFYVSQMYLRAADSGNVLAVDFTNNNGDNLNYIYCQAYGEYTITDSIRMYGMVYYSGTLIIDSPVNISEIDCYGSDTKSLTINLPVFRLSAWVRNENTNLTLTAPSTTFYINSYFQDYDGGTYARVKFTGNVNTYGSFTIDTLTLDPGIIVRMEQNTTIIVNDLIAQGTKTSLIEIESQQEGSQSSICKSSGTINVDYLKISDNAAVGGATFNANNSLDMGNNSGWNFTPPVSLNYYWTGGTGNWSDLGHWSQTSGGPADHTEFPGEFDNVYFDGNSFDATGQSVTVDLSPVNVHTLNMTGSHYGPTIQGSIDLNIHGSLILHDSVSFYIRYVYFRSDSAGNVINDAGAGNYYPYYYFYGNGAWTFTDSVSVYRIYHDNGALDMNGQPVNTYYFYSRYSAARSLDMGSSMIYIGYRWEVNGANLSLDPGTSTIYLDGANFQANAGGIPGLSYHDLVVNNYGNLYNSTTFNKLTVLQGSYLVLEGGASFQVSELVAEGTEAMPIYIQSISSGVQAGIVKSSGTVTGYYLHITDNVASGGAAFNAYFSDTTNSLGWNLMRMAQTVSFDTTSHMVYDPEGMVMHATASSGDVITYELISGDGMVSHDTLYANVPDTFMVRAFQAGNTYYLPSDTAEHMFIITRLDQVITFGSLADKNANSEPFLISATASSGLPVSFSLTGPATISNDTVYLTGETGIVEITASQSGNAYYKAAESVLQTFNVSKLDQVITFGSLVDKDASAEPFLISATASSGLPVTFSVTGTATISNDTIYLTGETGTVQITASQAGDAYYNAAMPVLQTFNVTSAAKTDQTITFDDIPDQTYGTAYIVLTATASSGLPVSFILVSGPATITADTVYIGATGTIQVMATQAGDATYNPASSVTRTFVVNKASQTITFTDIPDLTYGDDPYALVATSSSGLPVTFKVNSGNASVTLSEPDLIQNGSFDQVNPDSTAIFWLGWGIDNPPLPKVVDGVLICTPVASDQVWHYNINQSGLNALPDVDYIFMFKAWADEARTFNVDFEDNAENNYNRFGASLDPRTTSGYVGRSDWTFDVTTDPTWYTFNVNFDQILENTVQKVQFMLGTSGVVTYIDSVILVRNFELNIHGAGEVTVSAYQEGNGNYLAADPVAQGVTVAKAGQQVLFQTFEDVLISHSPIHLYSTASSGLPLTYALNGPASLTNDSTITLSGTSGVVKVIASQAGNADYNPVTDSTSFTVSDPGKTDQTITFDAIADQTYGTPWVVVSATATSGLTVEFAVGSGPATVSHDTVYLTGAGSVTVKAIQSGNGSYNPAPIVSRTFTVNKASQSISFTDIPDLTYGDDPYAMEATATSGLTVTFKVNSGKAQVDNNSLVITGAGSVTVSAYQAGNSNYLAADSVPQMVTVAKADQQIMFQTFENVEISHDPIALTSTATSGLSLAYTIKGPATLVSNTIDLTGSPGTVTVIANQAGNDDYNAVTDSASFTVTDPGKTNQTIDFTSIASQTYDKGYVDLTATASSGLTVEFTIVSGPATVSANRVNFTGTGTVQVKADQAGNGTYNPAPSVTNSFNITKGLQTLSFTDIPDMTFGDEPYSLEATATSGLTVTFKVNSGKAQVISNNLQLTGAGTVIVSAYQDGNSNYLPADSVPQSVTVMKASQQIIWQSLPDVTISNSPIPLTTSSTSGLPLTFSVNGPASITSNTLYLDGVSGVVTVFASHAGDADYLSVSDNKSFNVTDPSKQNQTITFAAIDDVELGVGSLTLTATASSGLTVTYELVSGPGTLAGSTITFTGVGTITVTAKQTGNTTYNPAQDVTRSFNVIENIPCPNPVSFNDQTICEGETVRLSVTEETGHSYSWFKKGTAVILSNTVDFEVIPATTTEYVYQEVLDSTECSVTDTFMVTVNPAPDFSYTISTNPINPGNNSTVTLTGAVSYTFDPSGSVSPITTSVFNVSPSENTGYIVTGLSTEGCGTEKVIDIFVYCDACSDATLFAASGSFNHGCYNRNYRNSANCTWTIFPSGQLIGIRIEFAADSFDILAGDNIKIYDGTDANGTLLGTYNNSNLPPVTGITTGTAAFIHFTSNATETGRGFQAHYSVITGVDDASGSYINIYPNPNSGIFTLEMKKVSFREAEAEIFSSLGQKIWNRNLEPVNGSVNETIELTGMPHGLYYMRIITREEVFYRTIVLE